jgi:hypothetical protein
MQAPLESWNPAPVETPTLLARAHGYRWITALYALLASICVLMAHALAPALMIALWQNVNGSSPSVPLAWTLFIGSFLLTFLLVIACGNFAGRSASERTGRRSSGLAAAAIVATCGAVALALGGMSAVLTQASPLTAVSSPPLGVASLVYHEGMAGGLALFYCAAYLPLLLLASAAGLLGALRGVRTFQLTRAGAPTRALPPTMRRVA